jgi:tellurite methyltransferase
MLSSPKPGTISQNERGNSCASAQPSSLLVQFGKLLPHSGLALDIACGYGQNTLYLARHGLTPTGIDLRLDALAAGREAAARANLCVSFVQADLTRFSLPRDAFSVVICFKYRDPQLYPTLRAALQPGGLLIYETYTIEHLKFGRKPLNPAHLLAKNELRHAFGDWEVIFYREVWAGRGLASLVARKPFPASESTFRTPAV